MNTSKSEPYYFVLVNLLLIDLLLFNPKTGGPVNSKAHILHHYLCHTQWCKDLWKK